LQKKLENIAGVYLNPPEHAILLCADKKSRIQALNRTQPGLPMKKGRCGTLSTTLAEHRRDSSPRGGSRKVPARPEAEG